MLTKSLITSHTRKKTKNANQSEVKNFGKHIPNSIASVSVDLSGVKRDILSLTSKKSRGLERLRSETHEKICYNIVSSLTYIFKTQTLLKYHY